MGRGISSVPVSTGNDRAPRVDQVLELFNFPPNVWTNLRFFPTALENECIVASHWVETWNEDGNKNKFSKQCIGFDRESAKSVAENCPYCTNIDSPKLEYFFNAIVREIQENMPARLPEWTAGETETWFKEKSSRSWTPVRVVRFSAAMVGKIQKYVSLMKAAAEDVEKGYDISILYDPKAKNASDKYTVQCGKVTPLTEEEWNYEYSACAYLIHDVGSAYPEHESWERAEAEATRIVANLVEEEPTTTGGGHQAPTKGGKGGRQAPAEDDGYGGGDMDASGGDEGYYEAPVTPTKGAKGGKGAPRPAPVAEDDYVAPAAKGGKGGKGAPRPAPANFDDEVNAAEASFSPPTKGGKGGKGAPRPAPAEEAEDNFVARPTKGGKGAKGGGGFGGGGY